VEQRYRAVLEFQAETAVAPVADRFRM